MSMSSAVERRTSARRGAVTNRLVLRFAGSQGSRRTEASLVNISRSGALIDMLNTPERLTLHQPVWVSMESPVNTGWIEAIPVRFDGEDQVGLTFGGPRGCGSHFLWAATSGLGMSRLGPSAEQDPNSGPG